MLPCVMSKGQLSLATLGALSSTFRGFLTSFNFDRTRNACLKVKMDIPF